MSEPETIEVADAATVAAVVAEMTAGPSLRALRPEEIEQRELEQYLRDIANREREQREAAQREAQRQAEQARQEQEVREATQKAARERSAQHGRERQAQAERDRIGRLENEWSHFKRGVREAQAQAAEQQRRAKLLQQYQRVIDAFTPPQPQLQPVQPAGPYEGSPYLGDADFNPELWK